MVKESMWKKAMEWLSGPDPKENDKNGAADPTYLAWLKEHPCALSSFDEMMKGKQQKQIVVFLDYDGTLSPIVNDPDQAFMSHEMRGAVREVARRFPTAIISGRSRDKVHGFVKLDEVYYAGSHGMDIMGPPTTTTPTCKLNGEDDKDQRGTIFQPAKDYLPSIKEMLAELKQRTCHIPGVFVEDNRFCISVHYRHVSNKDYPSLEYIVKKLVSDNYPSTFHLTQGKKVLEIRPCIKWNKGDALQYFLKTLGAGAGNNSNVDVLPFYIGDDKTDEDAFKVLRRRGQGHGIIVSSYSRETCATYSLHDPNQVLKFLNRLSNWGREEISN